MNPAASVQLSRLKEPQVKSGKMTERHGVPKEILFQRTFLIVQSIFFFFEVLFDETSPVVIEVFEYEGLVQRRLQGCLGTYGFELGIRLGLVDLRRLLTQEVWQGAHALSHLRVISSGVHMVQRSQVIVFIYFLIVFHDLLFVIFQSIEGVKEGKHGLGE